MLLQKSCTWSLCKMPYFEHVIILQGLCCLHLCFLLTLNLPQHSFLYKNGATSIKSEHVTVKSASCCPPHKQQHRPIHASDSCKARPRKCQQYLVDSLTVKESCEGISSSCLHNIELHSSHLATCTANDRCMVVQSQSSDQDWRGSLPQTSHGQQVWV